MGEIISMILINPVGMTLHDWADRSSGIFQQFGFRQRLLGDDWVRWGMNLIYVLAHDKGALLPRPDQFKDWQTWAVRLNQAIGG